MATLVLSIGKSASARTALMSRATSWTGPGNLCAGASR